MLQLIQVGQHQMYRTIKTELRAWVENPLFKIHPNQPVYILAKIIDADRAGREAHIIAITDGDIKEWFSCPFSIIHLVHDYSPELNAVMRIHGEPK